MNAITTDPLISVVLACTNPAHTLLPWLQAFAGQRDAVSTQLLVATAGDNDRVRMIGAEHECELVIAPRDALVPELWGRAMARARGTIVIVTISACVPAADWLEAIRRAYANTGAAAIGGTIDIGGAATLTDRAVHLVRYSAYIPPVEGGIVDDIAGDNGSYLRAAIVDLIPRISHDGFWEPEFHQILRDRGERLRLDPRVAVTFAGFESAFAFARQRYRHGRAFGRARAASHPTALSRFLRMAIAPAVPFAMLSRALNRMRTRRRLNLSTLSAVPLATLFFACWAAGEATGYAIGGAGGRR